MSTTPDLARQGGKGANLVRLAAAGLPVPPFVIAETDAYAAFVAAAGLDAVIADALTADAAQASETIRTAFAAAPLPDDLRARLVELIAPLAGGPVAVRSSATAEDLPGFSFAGQQDTFLDVTGVDAILHQIVACWSSLWTERAITYRERNGIGHDAVALAVVVQAMVDADASGVLFTANPRTGLRDETVIDATFGLGEALVSGQVTPDTFTVETATGTLRSRDITGPTPTLTTAHVGALTALGRRIADLYGEPMDVEWARVGDELSILQARPVTSLYPVPPAPDGPPQAWVSFGSVQGMLEPITPLGQDVLRVMLCGAPRALGRRVPWRTAPYLAVAGERLWLRVDAALRTRLTARLAARMLPVADPGIAAIVARLASEPAFAPTAAGPQPALVAGVLRFAARLAPRVRAARSHPVRARRRAERACADALAQVAQALERAATAPTPQARLAARVAAVEDAAPLLLPTILPHFAPIMVPSLRALGQLRRLAGHTGLPDAEALALAALRGLPGNVTTAMDVRLAETAETIRRDATAWGWVAETPASDLAEQYLRGTLPQGAQAAIAAFLADYGMRGVAEIDLGTLRWRDDPTSVVQALKAHLARPDSGLTPREEYTAGQRDAGRSLRALMDASTPRRAAAIRNEATVLRGLFGARETPKFTLIRAFGLIRDALDASATELVAAGRIAAASDVYLLHLDELRRAFDTDWHAVVAERRAVRDAEKRRGQVPRVLVSDGRAFFDGLSGEGEFGGVGVSPGVAEGLVHVVHDPRTEQLAPGEILVCRGTDPAWTPLFLPAAGLITEVGGLMTHGSVVAREYGIPAAVAVDGATTTLVTGQRIRIDGTSGAIELLPT
ncbi:PEP/pyruvate-binding domain-containing protein [Propioniciclava soli]|uniref:PEP/pyruvate-binding domain-containing protein n=1 Tax=Propioniciclava soli TaxID=2775081 RepID=UPI001E60440E|nr:PEP/pyruvate-binding domain-containing protein [Propioniciclava soli]